MANERWWRCTVCGYLHRGDAPPECCTICGARSDLFEISSAVPSALRPTQAPTLWRCLNCDFIHDGKTPPAACPVCGVGADQFEPAETAEKNVPKTMAGGIVIVGAGIAGLSAAEAARNTAPQAAVTLISQESVLPYYRLNLTRYLAGEITSSDLPVHPDSWYTERNITVLTSAEVSRIDRSARTVSLKEQSDLPYDKLVLAMGAHPSVPPIPGTYRKNVVTLRTWRDAEHILQKCAPGTECVIVGGGVLGLETAAALVRRQAKTTVVEGADWLLPRQLNQVAAQRLAAEARSLGIALVCGVPIKEIDGDERARSVVLESGEALLADLVIITAGVRSNSYLARMAGLKVNDGVAVDPYLRTSDPDIYAAGDLAEHQGVVYGTWAPAQFQGTIAGANAAGGDAVFAGIPRSNLLKVLGIDLFSIGQVRPEDASYRVFEENDSRYACYVFRDTRLVGAILVGDATLSPTIKKLIDDRSCCAELLSHAPNAAVIRAWISNLQP